uniref:Uncharacterized protein n=1 Tax=Rhizophora mucronata TaxID=61149 RepID=A0A2P2Q2N8_RHIMU
MMLAILYCYQDQPLDLLWF